jgi:hypothetical protein
LISDWFRHDVFGEKLEDEQVWFVDRDSDDQNRP